MEKSFANSGKFTQSDERYNNHAMDTTNTEKLTEISWESVKTYERRPGTKHDGEDYEYMMCTLFALLCLNDSIVDFEMTTNHKDYGDFDDLSLNVKFKDETEKKIFFQFKHKSNSKVKLTDLVSTTSNFGLLKYLKSFKNLTAEDDSLYILYTNAKFEPGNSTGTNMNVKNNLLQVEMHNRESPLSFLITDDVKKETSHVYQFTISDSTDESYQQFCKQFYFFTNQYSLKNIRNVIKAELTKKCTQEIYDSFDRFIHSWWKNNITLCKEMVVAKLVELTLSPFCRQLSELNVNDKTDCLVKAIAKFDLTIVKNYNNNVIENIWRTTTKNAANKKQVAKIYNLVEEHQHNLLLWHLREVPLIVEVNDINVKKIELAITLMKQNVKGIILVCSDASIIQQITRKFKDLNVLLSLSNLKSHKVVYNKILDDFTISLQGKKALSLRYLTDFREKLNEIIEFTNLLMMSQCAPLLIGSNVEKVSNDLHIKRNVLKILINTKETIDYCNNSLNCILIINCEEKIENFRKKFDAKNALVMKLDEYLTGVVPIKFENSIFLSSKCSFDEFESVAKKFPEYNIHLIEIFAGDENYSSYLLSNGEKLSLVGNKTKTISCKEEEIFNYFQESLNVVCASSGMGKSILFEMMSSTYCPPNFWSLHINLSKCSLFLKEQQDNKKMLYHLLELDTSNLESRIKSFLLVHKKMITFLDGLDELDEKQIDFVLNFIRYLISEGVTVWLSSRENLKEKISQALHVIPIEIQKLNLATQKNYIKDKLRSRYEDEEITEILTFAFDGSNKLEDFFKTPLHLFIFTEICLYNLKSPKNLKNQNMFVLTNLYNLFFLGRKQMIREELKTIATSIQRLNIVTYNEIYMEKYFLADYEICGVECCLMKEDLEKLEINENSVFMEKIKDYGDPCGIIDKDSENNSVLFTHHSYAEYFACSWLVKKENQAKVRLLKNELLSDKYQNLKFMFDIMLAEESPLHLAVIYKDMDSFNAHFTKYKNCKDEGGRSALHLLCSYGVKYPRRENFYSSDRLERECETYRNMLELLLSTESVTECDNLFNYTSVQYALKSRCLYPIEVFLKNFENFEKAIYEEFDVRELVYYSAQMGYVHILSAILQKNPKLVNSTFGELPLLAVAVTGAKDEIYVKSRVGNNSVVKLLLEKGAKVNAKDKYSRRSILDHACDNKYYDMLEMLIENEAKCTGNNTILHRTIKHSTFKKEVLTLTKYLKIDVNAQNENGQTALHIACENGLTENVEILLEEGSRVNICDLDNRNALYYSILAKEDNTEIVELLLNCGAHVNAQDVQGITPLHVACNKSKVKVVQILLGTSVDLNLTDVEEMNVLHYAAQSNKDNSAVIELLVNHGLDVNAGNNFGSPPLHHASKRSQVANAKKLIDKGADINLSNDKKFTSLHYAVQSWKRGSEIINLLVNNGISVNMRNGKGVTALHIECRNGLVENVTTLIESGGDVDIVDDEGRTALHYAVMSGKDNVEKLDILMKRGIKLNCMDKKLRTALHIACAFGQVENIKQLLNGGAELNLVDDEGMTVLHYAVKSGVEDMEIISWLINKEVNVNAKNFKGVMVLHTACQQGLVEIVKKLLSTENIDVNAVDRRGMSVLHYASKSKKQNTEITKLLLERGIEVNAQDLKGRTALQLACKKGHFDIVHELLENGANPNIADHEGLSSLHYVILGKEENMKLETLYAHNLLMNFKIVHLAFLQSVKETSKLVKLLLDKNTDVNAQSKNGATVLQLLCEQGKTDDVKLLLRNGTAVNSVDDRNMNALHYASQPFVKNTKIIKLLVKYQIDVNAKTIDGNTALHLLCERGQVKSVRTLLEKGADINLVNDDGMNALHFATHLWKPNTELIKLLIEYGSDVNARNNDGLTASHFVYRKREVKNIKVLLEAGADPNIVDNEKMNALQCCDKNKVNFTHS